MSDHTPGPWKAEYRERSLAVYQRTRSGAKTGRPICIVSRKDVANAHLIAAAPELLAALKLFAKGICNGKFQPTCRFCVARAAIAKAEGREP